MKKKLLLLPLLLLLLPCVGVRAHPGVSNYKIVSVTQPAGDTIDVTVQAEFCGGCHPDDRFVEVTIISSMGNFPPQTLRVDTNMATIWPLATLVTMTFRFSGLTLLYCDWITASATFWCTLCGYWYASDVDFHVISEIPFGTIMGLVACFAAVAAFVKFKRPKRSLLN